MSVALSAWALLGSLHPIRAQSGFCLLDAAPADGQPLFGNPETMLNAFLGQQGLTAMVPTHGAIGDLDGDGDLDAVSTYCWYRPADNPATQVSILLNRGDATFVNTAIYACGDYPTSVAIGDLDGDGLNDLAVTNGFSNQVSVLINAGGAVFPTHVGYAVGQRPRSVVIADLNGDGRNDLAVANAQSNTVSVLLNTGQGTFAPAATYVVAGIPDATSLFGDPFAFGGPYLAAGDVDADGDVDLAIPASIGVSLLRNNGNGTFAAYVLYPTGLMAWAVAIADVTGDARPDLITANPGGDSVSILPNAGNGAFGPAATHSIIWASPGGVYHPTTVALADLDHDGDLDLAVGTESSWDDTPVLMNPGDGSFGPLRLYHVERCPAIVALADLNGDGFADLAAFSIFQTAWQKLCVLMNGGNGLLLTDQRNRSIYAAQPGIWFQPWQIEFVDWEGDGDLDILVLNHGSSIANVAIQLNDGAGRFGDPVAYLLPGNHAYSMVVADLNGDGDLDIVATGPESGMSSAPGRATVLLHNADGTLMVTPSLPTGVTHGVNCIASDVDHDGDLDVVVSGGPTADISVLLNDGHASFAAASVQSFPPGRPFHAAAGDLNGDHLPDIVMLRVISAENVNMQVLWGMGNGTFVAGPIYAPPSHIGRVVMADLNMDGALDVVASNNGGGEPITLYVLLNDGAGGLGPPVNYWLPGTGGGSALRLADINLDGRLDVAVGVTGTAIGVLYGDGDGTFEPGILYGCGLDVEGIAVGDLDGDGDIDIGNVNTADYEGTYSILWNRACHALVGDLDGDGDIDAHDYALLLACLHGPGAPVTGCPLVGPASPDFDHDGDVDLHDAGLLFAAFTGP